MSEGPPHCSIFHLMTDSNVFDKHWCATKNWITVSAANTLRYWCFWQALMTSTEYLLITACLSKTPLPYSIVDATRVLHGNMVWRSTPCHRQWWLSQQIQMSIQLWGKSIKNKQRSLRQTTPSKEPMLVVGNKCLSTDYRTTKGQLLQFHWWIYLLHTEGWCGFSESEGVGSFAVHGQRHFLPI